MSVRLKDQKPFAQGGNRLCFVQPTQPDRCIKVRRPDFSLEALRASKGFPKNLRPLASFDDNLEERRVMGQLDRRLGADIYAHVSHCYGMVDTDLGPGLVSELIRDSAGPIALSLKQMLWERGLTDDLQQALDDFCSFWERSCIPSRQLLPHNIVAPRDQQGNVQRLVVIDGLGESTLLPLHWLPTRWQQRRCRNKTGQLRARVDRFLAELKAGKVPSNMGRLLHDGSPTSSS
ncbi:MAG: hypothetical protein CML06_05250 [Pseudomonadales bacterium]|nr:hypothetical protein [Pseudomonadales bacterium]